MFELEDAKMDVENITDQPFHVHITTLNIPRTVVDLCATVCDI